MIYKNENSKNKYSSFKQNKIKTKNILLRTKRKLI